MNYGFTAFGKFPEEIETLAHIGSRGLRQLAGFIMMSVNIVGGNIDPVYIDLAAERYTERAYFNTVSFFKLGA